MKTNPLIRLTHSLIASVAVVMLGACAEGTTLAPEDGRALEARPALHSAPMAGPELGSCDRLRAPAGTTYGFHAFARGVQIYRWNGTSWAPVGPEAELYADAGGHGQVGTHYAGPYWESVSGSRVKGAVIDRCTADASAIDWLSLAGTPDSKPGVFKRVVFIQRVNTVGGKAPAGPGATVGEEARVPYAAEYYFYRKH